MKTDQLEILVIQGTRQVGSVVIAEQEWGSVNYVDYVLLNANGELDAEMYVHGRLACEAMNALINRFHAEVR